VSTTAYTAPFDDMLFVLFDQLGVQSTLAARPDGLDRDGLTGLLTEARRVAEEVLSPINRVGDAEGVQFDGAGNVTTPATFKEAWSTIAQGGWVGVSAPPEHGGVGLPHVVSSLTTELFFGAATAFMMYPGLTATAARMLANFAPEHLRDLVVQKLFAGEWAGTMCLTEAGAGSDVGSNRARATPTAEPGVYHLEGEKIFISGGDHDLTPNILHVILARTPSAPSGTRGLSIFLVPKFDFDAAGQLGARNHVRVSNIEHKMGLNGSATCTLLLGDGGPCKGWLLGREGEGMSIMFHMMNEARVGVGIQSLGVAANAFDNALSYTRERRQGAAIDKLRDPEAPRAAIVDHPDVRRMLLLQRCQIEATRSLLYKLGHWLDLAEQAPDDAARQTWLDAIDLLTPIAKGHVSDTAFECTVLALQCLGGYGFIREYPVEQHVRDAKIFSIYEGTNGIQAMDLVGRKLRQRGGALFMGWMERAGHTAAAARAQGLGAEADAIERAVQGVGASAMHLGGLAGQGALPRAMLHASTFLRQMGVVVLALESLEQATVAARAIAAGDARPLLAGKLLNLRFYVGNLLPLATAAGKILTGDDGAALDEALFA
jgi:alkylation response protein AidB-like acyl-CoA dehydrogenase